MVIVDTNIILRYVLNDHFEMSTKAKNIMMNKNVLILTQVIAEVIYVLRGVYKSTRQEVVDILLSINDMNNVYIEDEKIVVHALNEFADTSFDFTDALLYSYHKYTGINVMTFDKKLNTKLEAITDI